jgi:hypothetical protein
MRMRAKLGIPTPMPIYVPFERPWWCEGVDDAGLAGDVLVLVDPGIVDVDVGDYRHTMSVM